MKGRGESVRRRIAGFTLIEVMVVLLIVGIAAGGFGIALDAVAARDAEHFRNRLRLVLMVASDRAMNRGETLRLERLPGAYRFTRLDASGLWMPVADSPLLLEQRLPSGWQWGRLSQADRGSAGDRVKSGIVFSRRPPDYEMEIVSDGRIHRIKGRLNGEAEWLDG